MAKQCRYTGALLHFCYIRNKRFLKNLSDFKKFFTFGCIVNQVTLLTMNIRAATSNSFPTSGTLRQGAVHRPDVDVELVQIMCGQ